MMPGPLPPAMRRRIRAGLLAVPLACGCGAAGAGASADAEANFARVGESLASGHAAERYRRLAEAAADFDEAARASCDSPPPRKLDGVTAAYHAAMDAWTSVEHVRHGPIELHMRGFRMHFWPDRRGRGGRQVQALLSSPDAARLSPETLRSASVAVQGFPAAERLLFDGGPRESVANGAGSDPACRLLVAIAGNLADMSARLSAEWSAEDAAFRQEIRDAGSENSRFASHREATAEFVRGAHTTLQVMAEMKVDRVMGKSTESARPRRAESWRSGRSLRNVVRNLEAIRAMYEGENGPGIRHLLGPSHADLAGLLSRAFRQTLETARAIPSPLSRAVVDPAARDALARLSAQLRGLMALVGGRVAPALGAPLGFNALDGD